MLGESDSRGVAGAAKPARDEARDCRPSVGRGPRYDRRLHRWWAEVRGRWGEHFRHLARRSAVGERSELGRGQASRPGHHSDRLRKIAYRAWKTNDNGPVRHRPDIGAGKCLCDPLRGVDSTCPIDRETARLGVERARYRKRYEPRTTHRSRCLVHLRRRCIECN